MASFIDMIEGRSVTQHHGCARVIVGRDAWRRICGDLAAGHLSLLGLWVDADAIHMAVLDQRDTGIARPDMIVVSLECPDGCFPSVGALHPPAIRLERAIRSLYGLEPVGLPDARPWLDLGFWDTAHPLAPGGGTAGRSGEYAFLPVDGEGLHQIPVGPVHAGIIEPGHFRFTANGETVVRLEERLGYVHKGIESLMTGATLDRALRLAGRASGDSTVAYALAFAHAVEAACLIEVPPRAIYLRALMSELERIANHFGDIGAVCNDASFAIMHAQCAVLRERVLRAADAGFGHRLMMDVVTPGGVALDLSAASERTIRDLIEEINRTFPALIELYDNTASLQDRTTATGVLLPGLARQFAAGGYVGRASGRTFDARKTLRYPPYDVLEFDVPVLAAGDVSSRVWIRIREVEQSLGLIKQILDDLPKGATFVPPDAPSGSREGLALVEGFRGDVLAWIRIEGSRVLRCHLRDPSWFQWPLLEAAIEGNIVADFPLCNKSFNCSYSGHDL